MTRISQRQARQLGIDTKGKKQVLNMPTWDAATFPGGVWLQIPFVPPSLNVWKNWHWSKQHKYKKELYQDVKNLAMALKLPRYNRATVQIIYYHKTKRRRDPADNYAPKFLMDALVNGGILMDDNGDLVNVEPVVMKIDKEKARTEIFIWEKK